MRLSKRDLNRLRGVVGKVEQTPNKLDRPHQPIVPPSCWLAVTTTSVSALSGTTFGQGSATFQIISGTTSGSSTTYSYAAMPGSQATVTVLNISKSTITSGTLIGIVPINGQWVINFVSC